MTDGQTDRYLASFRPLADESFIHGCERGGIVVDVQQTDEDGNAAALPRIICKHAQRKTVTAMNPSHDPPPPPAVTVRKRCGVWMSEEPPSPLVTSCILRGPTHATGEI